MIQDVDLHLEQGWEKKVGPDIGGPVPFLPPDAYGFVQGTTAMRFDIRGKAYTDWLAALHRPLLLNTGHLSLMFELMTDLNALTVAQAIEIDTRISAAGWNFNHSFQNNYQSGGMLQISGQDNNWVDTGIKFGKFQPRAWYAIGLHYSFDAVAFNYRTERIQVGDETFDLSLPTLKAQKLGWTDGAHLQVQQDLAASGGSYSIYTRNMRYIWT